MSKSGNVVHFFIMLAGDAAIFYGSLYVALAFRELDPFVYEQFIDHIKAFTPLLALYLTILYIAGFYDRRFVPTARRTFDRLFPSHALATIGMGMYFYLMPVLGLAPKTNLAIFTVVLFAAMFAWKAFGTRLFALKPTRAVLIGKSFGVKQLLAEQPLWNISIVEELTNTVGLKRIEHALCDHHTDTVLVNIGRYPRIDVLYKLIFNNTEVIDTASIDEELNERINLENVDELWFIQNIKNQQDLWRSLLTRLFDIILSVPLLLAYVLVLPFIYAAIKYEDGGPLYIRMPRIGCGGKQFFITKFRSMTPDKPGTQKLYDHNKKVTRVGAFIRKTAIDEFPQAISILLGQQSFVGPRPEIPSLVQKYEKAIPHYNMRHMVRPGLSGWAQIKQKNAPHHTTENAVEMTREKLSYDLYYIKNHSVFLYIKIVLQTLGIIINRTNH